MELQLQQVDLKWNAEKFAPTPFKRASHQTLLKERNTAMESFTFFYLEVKFKKNNNPQNRYINLVNKKTGHDKKMPTLPQPKKIRKFPCKTLALVQREAQQWRRS